MLKEKLKLRRMNKKAMFFTILAIAILSLFVVSYTFSSVIKDRKSINKRITTMNNFVFSVEQDLPRQLYISGYRTIFLFEKSIADTGIYITNLNEKFQEAFFNGTINGEVQEVMQGATFSDIQTSLNEKANKINADVSLTNPSFAVEQEDPWHIKVTLTANLLIKDKTNLVSWNKTSVIVTYISIENFEDPLYVVNTGGLVTNKINRTVYEVPIAIANLPSHAENSFYINSTSAPSFLDRLQGNLEANENGIESLVYFPRLSAQGITIKDKSCVDYIYFSSSNPSAQNIAGMPDWFKLDNEHLGLYGV